MRVNLVCRSRPMRTLLAELKRYAVADANVLVLGETGAGKDMVARPMARQRP